MGRNRIGKKLKEPSEYPTLAFRVEIETKAKLEALIAKVQVGLNSKRTEGDPTWTKGDVIVKALYLGLKELKNVKR